MGLPLKLTIEDGQGTTHVYEDDRILTGVDTLERRVRGLDIELQDLPIVIGPSSGGQNQLAGYTNELTIPETKWRAKLERPGGPVLMNGAILTTDTVYAERRDEWRLTLINQAPEDFWQALEASFLPANIGATITTNFIECNIDRNGIFFENTEKFFQPRELLQELLDDQNITYSMPSKLWEYEIEYAGGTRTVDSTDLRISLGDENKRTLVEEITKLAGWRTRVEYQGFPSTDLHVEFLKTSWPAPNPVQDLTPDLESDSYQATIKPQNDNWALQLGNGPDDQSPDPRNRKYAEGGRIANFATPPPWASVAPEAWQAAPPFQVFNTKDGLDRPVDDREMIVDAKKTQFTVPPIEPIDSDTVASGTEDRVYGRVRLKQVAELPLQRLDTTEKLYIFEHVYDSDRQKHYAVHSRHPTSGEYDPAKTTGHMPAWASAAFEAQVLRGKSHYEADGSFIDVGAQTIGDPTTLIEMEINQPQTRPKKKWIVWEEGQNLSSTLSELVLRRPTAITQNSDQPSKPSSGLWIVIKPRAEYRTINQPGTGDEDWFLLHWERTPQQDAAELWYHVEYKDNRQSNPSYQAIGEISGSPPRTYSTALAYQFKAPGNGGNSPSGNDFVFRVRPVKGYGDVGDWRTFQLPT